MFYVTLMGGIPGLYRLTVVIGEVFLNSTFFGFVSVYFYFIFGFSDIS